MTKLTLNDLLNTISAKQLMTNTIADPFDSIDRQKLVNMSRKLSNK